MNSFFSLKIGGGRQNKPIVSRQKLVNRDKKIVVIVAAITAGVLTFSLSMGRRLLEINQSNSIAISGPATTISGQTVDGLVAISKQVKENKDAERELRQSYEIFNNERDNMNWSRRDLACISPCQNEEVNPVLTVLDALPSRYDSLVLRHQLQDFFDRNQFQPESIGLPHSDETEGPSDGSWIEIPIEVSLKVEVNDIQRFVNTLDYSIRPMIVDHVTINRGDGSSKWSLQVVFTTYYQPETELTFAEVVIPEQQISQPEDPTEDEDS